MISGQWSYRKRIFKKYRIKLHKMTKNSIEKLGSTPFLINLVGAHPGNIHRKFEANQCSGEKSTRHLSDDGRIQMGCYIVTYRNCKYTCYIPSPEAHKHNSMEKGHATMI